MPAIRIEIMKCFSKNKSNCNSETLNCKQRHEMIAYTRGMNTILISWLN